MTPEVLRFLSITQIWAINQTSRRPISHDFYTVDRGAKKLVVSLYDAQVAADEDEFARPFRLVAENFTDTFAHLLLHFVGVFGGFFAFEAVAYRCRCAFIPAFCYCISSEVIRFGRARCAYHRDALKLRTRTEVRC